MNQSLKTALNKIAMRANRAAFKKINEKRKKMKQPLLKYDPNRNYWA